MTLSNKLYVGNLSWNINDQELGEFFSKAGEVLSAAVIVQRDTGRSRGFGFVEMSTPEEVKKAIKMFNGADFNKRNIIVNEAKEERNGANQDFTRTIGDFIQSDSKVGDTIGFSSDDKHFTITRDE